MFMVVVQLESEPSPQSPVYCSHYHTIRFSSRSVLDFSPSVFLSTLTSFSVPTKEKHPHSMMLPPLCFTMECCIYNNVQCFAFHQTKLFACRPKGLILLSSEQNYFLLITFGNTIYNSILHHLSVKITL
ncbi:hypothetical protein XENORESO_006457 [Xenotaenia resolanae]|uniref:Uncharacterized protein n=1 Tax=Xenotaenia resolanae TaxID=208358 RepID=A0ABV0VXT7_9TELE